MSTPEEVTQLLNDWGNGDREALDKLIRLVYSELHRLAESKLRRERSDHTLQPTALVNEAYIRLASWSGIKWQNRAHFLAVAASVMRNILVDHSRSHSAQKRGGNTFKVSIDDVSNQLSQEQNLDLEALDNALKLLEQFDPQQCRIVELRYFGGLTHEETAEVMQLSVSTVRRELNAAKAWLFRELSSHDT